MIVRGMIHHVPRLRRAIVLCSVESMTQVHLLGNLLRRYPEFRELRLEVLLKRAHGIDLIEIPTTESTHGGWHFENFDDLSDAMLWLLRRLKDEGVEEDEIMIDFTGGFKVTSVVAASVTFNRKLKAQCVPTTADVHGGHEPIGYDCLLESSETPGL